MRSPSVALAALLLLPCSAAAQGSAASPRPAGTRLTPGRDSLAVYLIRGTDTSRTGIIREDVSRVDAPGGPLLVRWYRTEDSVLGSRADSLVDRLADLTPVRSRSWSDRSSEVLDFAAGRVTGWIHLVSGDSVRVDLPLDAGVINSASFDMALRAAPLAPGWTGSFPAFLGSARSLTTLTARVAGEETIGDARCWRVDAVFGSLPVTFWIDQRTRRLRQQSMQIGPDTRVLFGGFPATQPKSRSS